MTELFQFALSAEIPRNGVLRSLRRLSYLEDLYNEASARRDAHKATAPDVRNKQVISKEWKDALSHHLLECDGLMEEMCSVSEKMDTEAREILARCQYRKCRVERAIKRRRADPDVPEMHHPAEVEEKDIDLIVPYCFCWRGTFGVMVACDHRDCKVEWFHLECVGLKEVPNGKWYCPNCKK